jgi:hypothetical protein
MRPRALLVPPGFPDYLTRRRILDRGRITVHGRAWSGQGTVSAVEFCVDGLWINAALEKPSGPYSWCAWSTEWDAAPGEHVLSCRATDSAGNVQPTDPSLSWNFQGMGNNLAQEVSVTVR